MSYQHGMCARAKDSSTAVKMSGSRAYSALDVAKDPLALESFLDVLFSPITRAITQPPLLGLFLTTIGEHAVAHLCTLSCLQL